MRRISIKLLSIVFAMAVFVTCFAANAGTAQATTVDGVTYRTHVQNYGWQDWVSDGEMSGTSGESLRLEGINIKLSGIEGGITYRTHVQSYGWQAWVSDGEMAGTSGESKRLEAIEIKLTGEAAELYDIYYRVHAQNFGWLDWAENGASAGSAGYSYRLEGIEIVLVEKDSEAPGDTETPFKQAMVRYQTHVQNVGWQGLVGDGAMSGTSGRSLRLEGIKISLNKQPYEGSVSYRTHVQNIGWQDWVSDGEMSGTSGKSLRLEAIQIKLTGEMAENYDIYYRVHAQNLGWLGWAKNGDMAGTSGCSYRLEAIEIRILPKGTVDSDMDTTSVAYVAGGPTITAFDVTDTTVTLSWKATNCDKYVIYTYPNGTETEIMELSPDTTSITLKRSLYEGLDGYSDKTVKIGINSVSSGSSGAEVSTVVMTKSKSVSTVVPYIEYVREEFASGIALLDSLTPGASNTKSYKYYHYQTSDASKTRTSTTLAFTSADIAAIKAFEAKYFESDWTDGEKIAFTVRWINLNNTYDYNYKYSGSHGVADVIFNYRYGQCLQYNGAVCELMNYMGYDAYLVARLGSRQHFWTSIMINGTEYDIESGTASKYGAYWCFVCEEYY